MEPFIDVNGIKIYEGDWHQGLYEGYGKLFNDLGKMTYEGEFKNGLKLIDFEARKEGIHQEYYDNGVLKYNGELERWL